MEKIDKKRKIEQTQLFKISRMKEVIKPTKPHKHDGYHELIILNEGAGIHTIDEIDYEVNPPTMFYLKTGQVNCWDFNQIPKGFVMIFKELFLDEYSDVLSMLTQLPTQIKLSREDLSIWTDFEQIMGEFQSDQPDTAILKNYLHIIIHRLTRMVKCQPYSNSVNQGVVVRFKQLVDRYYKSHKDIGFYAGQLGLTKRKLSQLCSTEIGRPAGSVISERLVMESKRILRYTNNSISEIAFELDYTDPSHFVKFFKSKTNLTPLEFRKRF